MDIVSPESVGLNSRQLDRIGDWAAGYVAAGKLPFATTLVARHGQVAFLDCRGMADLAADRPARPDDLVRLYSMTKPVTAVAALMLYEAGVLQLDDPVAEYIPAFADLRVMRADGATEALAEPVRLWHLFTHTAGLTYGHRDEGPVPAAMVEAGVDFGDPTETLAATVDRLAEVPLKFQPGTRWNYGVSTDVLGRVVEVAAGVGLDRFFADRIFAPLGMTETGFSAPADTADRLTACYDYDPEALLVPVTGPREAAFTAGTQMCSGGGGLVGTLADYLRFCEMLRGGGALGEARLLGRKTVAMMASNWMGGDLTAMGQPTFSEMPYDGIGFGLGVSVVVDPAKTRALYSSGEYAWGGAASTAFWIDPQEDMVVIFLTQVMPSSTYPLRRELRALVNAAVID